MLAVLQASDPLNHHLVYDVRKPGKDTALTNGHIRSVGRGQETAAIALCHLRASDRNGLRGKLLSLTHVHLEVVFRVNAGGRRGLITGSLVVVTSGRGQGSRFTRAGRQARTQRSVGQRTESRNRGGYNNNIY